MSSHTLRQTLGVAGGKRRAGWESKDLLLWVVQVYTGLNQTWPNHGVKKLILVTHLFLSQQPSLLYWALSWGFLQAMDLDKTRCTEQPQKLTLQILYKGKLYTGRADLSLSPQNHLLYPKMQAHRQFCTSGFKLHASSTRSVICMCQNKPSL